jgi:PAS domain S-box-containing protein
MSEGTRVVVDLDGEALTNAVSAIESRRPGTVVTGDTEGSGGAADAACLVYGPTDDLPAVIDAHDGGAPIVCLLDPDGGWTVADALDAGAADAVRLTGDWPDRLAARVERAIEVAGHTERAAVYEKLVESSNDSTRLVGREGTYDFVDERTASLAGIDRAALVGERPRAFAERGFLEDADVDGYEASLDAVLSGESEEERVETAWDVNGRRVSAETRLTPVRNGDDEVEGAVAITRDVSERRAVERELRESESAIRDLHEAATRTDLDFAAKVRRMLVIGRERVGLDVGLLSAIDPQADGDEFHVVVHDGTDESLDGHTSPLSEVYCRETIERDGPYGITDAEREGLAADPAYEKYGMACYLGSEVRVDGELYGTLCFMADDPREDPFTEGERVFVDLLAQWVSYELERQEREHELAAARDRSERILERIDDGFFAVDEDWSFTYLNAAAERMLGVDADALLGENVWESFPAAMEHAFYDEYHRAMDEQEPVTFEEHFPPLDTWFSVAAYPSPDGLSVYFQDVTERKRQERALRDLQEVTSRRDIGFEEKVRRAIEIGRERTGMEAGFFATVDTDTDPAIGGFQVVVDDGDDPQFGDHSEAPLAETYCRKTIDSDEPLGVTDADETWTDDPAYQEYELACYLGGRVELDGELYGTLCFTHREPRTEPFTESESQFVSLLTQWLSYELERREREATLEKVLDRVNGLVRDVVRILVEASTREEIEQRVVERLAAVPDYEVAWLGKLDVAGEALEPVAWTDDDRFPFETASFDVAGEEPGASVSALRDGEATLRDYTVDPVADCPLGVDGHDIGAAISAPLTYKDTDYGVLTVYTDDPDAFDERERVVLSALGRAIANAYNAIETGRILDTDKVVELNISVGDPDLLFTRLAAATDGVVEYAGSVYKPDGTLRLFATATDADPEAVLAAAEAAGVQEAACLADDDGDTLFEFAVDESIVSLLADHGAVTRAIESDGHTATVTVELPAEAEARDLYEIVADNYDGADLVGYHEHDRPVETRQEFRAALEDRLTDRQQTALQSAFLSGFFEWPRPVSGDELAESMDISRPTFHQHLRTAERKVFEELFDPED